jgi:PleD family two-component response regulator
MFDYQKLLYDSLLIEFYNLLQHQATTGPVISGSFSRQDGKKKILAVNDELDMTTILKMTLERVGFNEKLIVT